MTDSEIIGSQKYTNTHLFHQWCINLFDVTKLIENESQQDAHHCRWFYIALWELLTSGERYVQEQLSYSYNANCQYLIVSNNYIERLKNQFDDTDFFMLQYYRHSSAHIFQSEYALVDKLNAPKLATRTSTFISKDGSKNCKLTQDEIRQKVKSVIGQYGLGEQKYRGSLISRTYSLIRDWCNDINTIMSNLP